MDSMNGTQPQAQEPVIEIHEMTKTYQMGETQVHALNGVSLTIERGEYVAIIGTSGSGKSTLMNMIGLLDRPTSGSYRIGGFEASKLSKSKMADLRNQEIGFVFQRFNLLARTNARRQVELPLFYADVPSNQAAEMAVAALQRVGLGDRTDHKPDELSGGQQQRVAIARALVNRPSILLADEPTGALDTKTSDEVMALFDDLHRQGITLVVVTHDMEVAERAERMITLRDGLIIEDRRKQKTAPPPTPEIDHASQLVTKEMATDAGTDDNTEARKEESPKHVQPEAFTPSTVLGEKIDEIA